MSVKKNSSGYEEIN